MLFLNMGLLLGLLGVSIPVLIHLFNRKSGKVTDWGAIQFLLESHISSRRRVLIEELLLLGSRCLLIALVALAMARPLALPDSSVPWLAVLPMLLLGLATFGASFALWRYPRWRRNALALAMALLLSAAAIVGMEKWLNLRRFGGSEQRDVVLVIDGSSSMTMMVDGKTNFQRAIEAAEASVLAFSRKTAFALVIAGPSPNLKIAAPVTDRKEVLAQLQASTPVYGTMHVLDALSAAGICLAQGYNSGKQIILFTDGQAAGWETDSPARWEFLARAFETLPAPPQIIVRSFDLPEQFRNVGIRNIALSREVVGADREVGIAVDVVNTGTEAVTPSAITLHVDGQELNSQAVSQLAPGAMESVTFRHRFTGEGTHVLEARAKVNDDLAGDDAVTRVVNVVPRLRVLIVDGNPAGRFVERAGALAALALAPAAQTGRSSPGRTPDPQRQLEFLVSPSLVDAPDIRDIESFNDYEVVILADVPQLPAVTSALLARYVHEGGGLLIAPGQRAVPGFYNQWLTPSGERLSPAELASPIAAVHDEDVLHLSPTTFDHSALRAFAEADPDATQIRMVSGWTLQPSPTDPRVSVAARFNNGAPFLVERLVGRGSVMLTAGAFNIRSGNLTTRHSFVPLLHELVYHLAMPGMPSLNVAPGNEIAFQLPLTPPGEAPVKGTKLPQEPQACSATDPVGQSRLATVWLQNDRFLFNVRGDVIAGPYQLFVPDVYHDALTWAQGPNGGLPFTITRDVEESRLMPLTETDRELVQQHVEAVEATSDEDLLSALSGRAFGDELWRPLAAAAFALLLLEILLSRWIAIRRQTGEKPRLISRTSKHLRRPSNRRWTP